MKCSAPILKLIKLEPMVHNVYRRCGRQAGPAEGEVTPLARHLQAKIRTVGPITVAEYMKEVLTSPASGYYMHGDMIGERGDFVTSPELSQMFGEMVGVWLYSEWQKVGAPRPMQLVELGPGRGSLAHDILRVFARLGAGGEGGRGERPALHLVEVSPRLSDLQAELLCPGDSRAAPGEAPHYREGTAPDGTPVRWHRALRDVPRRFSCVVAHEFFDALPAHKLQKTDEGWREVLVDVDPGGAPGRFRFVLSRSETPACKLFIKPGERRAHLEVSPESCVLVQHLAQRLRRDGGLALVVDYGHDGTKTDTFRAFRRHRQCDPLVAPGTADLTVDVDFSYLRGCAGDSLMLGPVSQASFLERMGIHTRLQVLLGSCRPEQREGLLAGYRMMVDPDQMGECFRVMAVFPSVLRDHLARFPVAGFPPPPRAAAA
ncbi:protein arginine methyltransferase NDUFAF7, mitochondrial isoform X2 [Bacillus rossius redtenbacheri]|uniref:protein arginine methyltransferase NDUFAF7, mitochondrial isoform X2 n=1 Tax=Bacillus rossius redtenbacheri TaxID=93214 RepID=UPI002FDD7D93